jgi:tetratricopeptide (TPR) repeat protein
MVEPSSEDLIRAAEAAEAGGDLEGAVTLWEEHRTRFPDAVYGFGSGGAALRRLGRLPEAIALLVEGISRFPDDEWLANEHAWTVFETGDLARAAAEWALVRQRFPGDVDAYIGGGLTARRAGAFDAADALYRAGLERFPKNATLHVDFAWCAEEAKNLRAATARWATVVAQFPDLPEGYIRRGHCLLDQGLHAEADEALSAAIDRFPGSADALRSHAWVAQTQGDWPEALRRWERALVTFPELREPRRYAAQCLMELGRTGEAAQVLGPALRLYPEDPDVCVLNGWLATRRGDLEAAEPLWREVRERFPERVDGYWGHVVVLRDRGRLDDADALLTEAHGRFPGDPVIALEFARVPERKGQWALAIHRWHEVIVRFPERADGYLGLSRSLRRAQHEAEADAVLEDAGRRHPNDFDVAAAIADAAVAAGKGPGAPSRWAALTERFPAEPRGYVRHGEALRQAGELESAAGVLRAAYTRFAEHVELGVALAWTLCAQRRWAEALPLWASLKERFPGDGRVLTGITETVAQALADQEAHGESWFDIPAILLETGTGEPPSVERRARLLERFESLGDTCEFGMVQRLYHVEHVSLLRWAHTLPDDLVTALNTRLGGVGDPEYTRIHVSGDEYTTEDTRYFMRSHTFTSPRAEPLESFAPEQCRRLQWLRRRQIESLTTAARIFVYKSEHGISDAQVAALLAALRQYSPRNVLLCVRLQTAERPSGSLDEWEEGLFVGYIDRFSTVDINVEAWLALCEGVAGRCA